MAQQDPNDLTELIDAAARQVSRKEAAKARKDMPRGPGGLPKAVLAIALAGAVALGWTLWSKLAPPSASQVERDLESAVELARQSVESARKGGGALPQALPNAALAAVVGYEPGQDGYRLVANLMGIRVTLERDGTRKVEKEGPK